MIGFPSVEKPWLKYYSKEAVEQPLPECTIYEYMLQNNAAYPNDIAINYLGHKILYKELFDRIDQTAAAFAAIGVKPEEIVTVALPSIPEAVYVIYALNKIGAVANMIHPLAGEIEILNYLNETESRVAILFSGTYQIIKNSIKNTKVTHAIVITARESLPLGKKQIFAITSKRLKLTGSMFYSWESFIFLGHGVSVPTINRDSSKMAIISHTGGTTGEPKGVMCSDYNINAVIWQVGAALPHRRQEKILVVLPPFINYSLVNSMLEPLALGIQVIMLPEFKVDKFDKIIMRYHPNHINSIPLYWEALLENPNIRKIDLSCLKYIYYGGEGMNPELEKEVSNLLVSGGAQLPLCKGFGETELISSATLSFGENNILGSVGVPLVKVECKIVKEGTQEEVQCGQEGEICFSGPTLMMGYYNNQKATDEIIKRSADGARWMHTGDLGYINNDGVVFVTGRIKRILMTKGKDRQATKIFPDRIEKALYCHPAVDLCCVIGIPDKQRINYPKAFVVLKKGFEESEQTTNSIIESCKTKLPEYMIPDEIEYRIELPRTERGKVDYRALEKQTSSGREKRNYH